jgi:hypothetical membrane protein
MSIISRSVAVPPALTAPLGKAVSTLKRIPTIALAAAALCSMLGGILLSALTTTDPLWWQEHFSQLGTFHNLSAAFFNGGLILAGGLVVLFAVRVWGDIARLGPKGGFRGAATVAFVCLSVIGVNLSLVGMVPMNTDQSLHDRVAGSMVLGFLGLLITSPIMLHRLPRRLLWATAAVFAWMATAIGLFVTATINLTLFEVLGFTAMFTWAGIFVFCLGAPLELSRSVEQCTLCSAPLGLRTASKTKRASLLRLKLRKGIPAPGLCFCE